MRFRHERGPEGKWAPLASATVSKRLQRYGNRPVTILRQEGELYSSIQYQTTASSLMIGTRSGSAAEPYAAIHQFGGKAGRGKKVTITARPYLGFADDDMDVIEDEVAAFLAGS
jgi:phage virion morphogenesis protein